VDIKDNDTDPDLVTVCVCVCVCVHNLAFNKMFKKEIEISRKQNKK
jgi:hypothetical protein